MKKLYFQIKKQTTVELKLGKPQLYNYISNYSSPTGLVIAL